MINYQGKWALITGASSGIGEVYAQELAKKGVNLVLVARSHDKLTTIADKLSHEHDIQIDILAVDLSKPDASQQIFNALKNSARPIRILINNAGFGVFGKLAETSLERNQEEIMVNVFAVASLTQLLLPDMVKHKDGIIINLASIAGFQPLPYMANYGASKAFVLSFSEALWAEYRSMNIRVLAVCPGPVSTNFANILGMKELNIGKSDTALNVVTTSLKALERDCCYIIPGPAKYYWISHLSRFFTRAITAKISENLLRRRVKSL